MTKLYVTYCSRGKMSTPGTLPAIKRYMSDRILDIYELSRTHGVKFAILSGKFGLVEPDQQIPWYDHLMTEEDIPTIKEDIREYILDNNISEVKYFTVNPKQDDNLAAYFAAIQQAVSELINVSFSVSILNKQ